MLFSKVIQIILHLYHQRVMLVKAHISTDRLVQFPAVLLSSMNLLLMPSMLTVCPLGAPSIARHILNF